MIKIIETCPITEILDCYFKIEKGIIWTEYNGKKQSGLQFKENEDPWASAVGKSQGNEFDYTNLNPFFKDTIFENLINQYKLKRTRLMWTSPMTCYSMHRDSTPRVHIPLITNSDCYFVFQQGIVQHLPIGYAYWFDTTKKHTFINCSTKSRLHLIGVVQQ